MEVLEEAWHKLFIELCKSLKIPQVVEWMSKQLTKTT